MSTDFLPVSRKDMEERGIEQLDFVYVIGDAYVDHNACQKSGKSFRISDQSLSDFRKSKEKQRCNNNEVHNEKYEKTRRKE